MKFGIFYEHQLPRPWSETGEYELLQEGARPDRAGRPARLRLCLGGRAPFPRGILAFLGARGVPGRGQPAHQAHPPRPRHRASSPPTSRTASPSASATLDLVVRRARRVRHGRGAPGRPSCTRSASACATSASGGRRRSARHHADVHPRHLGVPRAVLRLPRPQRGAEAAAEAAPAALGGVLQHRDHRPRPANGAWARWASASSRPRRRSAWVQPLLQQLAAPAAAAGRLSAQSQHRHRQRLHVRADRRGGDREGRRLDLLHLRAVAITAAKASTRPAPAICGTSTRTGGRPRRRRRRCATA